MQWAMKPGFLKFVLNCWPPFFFSGIKVEQISDDFCYVRVKLKSRPWTKNINRTQFGGSMFSMTDPIYPLMVMGALGSDYHVWDKKADIDFIAPGRGTLIAEFWLSDSVLHAIKTATDDGDKHFPEFLVHIKDSQSQIVCEVNRTIYVRKKKSRR